MTATAQHVFEARSEVFQVALGARPEGSERFSHAIDLLWGIFQGPALAAWHELIVAARTDPELQPVVATFAQGLRDEVNVIWADLFPGGIHGVGREINAAVPALLFSVLDGLALARSTGAASAADEAEHVLTLLKLLAAYFDALPPLDRSSPNHSPGDHGHGAHATSRSGSRQGSPPRRGGGHRPT